MKKTKRRSFLTVREIAEIALLVSIAILLDQSAFKIKVGAPYGSISFTMVPLIFIALRYDFLKSLFAIGIIYGFVTTLTDGASLIAYPLDYFLAYGSLSLLSFLRPLIKKEKITFLTYLNLFIGIISVLTLRLFFHTVSGVLIWEAGWWGSFTYNLFSVIIPPLIPTIASVLLLLKTFLKLDRQYSLN